MNPEIKERWLAALRSDDYTQGVGQLARRDPDAQVNGETFRYCCLGVLCDLAERESIVQSNDLVETSTGWREPIDDESSPILRFFNQDQSILPDVVAEWAGLKDHDPHVDFDYGDTDVVDGTTETLSGLNDNGVSFSEIADVIEEQL